jgi:tetratricopeptide (TPR) repeat protein
MTRLTLLLLLWLLAALPAPAQTPPDPFHSRLQAGQAALRAGLPLLAAREYRAAVRLRPADADAHFALAGVLEAAGQADEAMAEYQRTIALRPDNAPAHNALAGLLEDQGARGAALAQYRQAVALLPSDPHLRFNLGGALADSGQRAQAAAQYREALRLKPDFAEAGRALRALGTVGTHPAGTPPASFLGTLPGTEREAGKVAGKFGGVSGGSSVKGALPAYSPALPVSGGEAACGGVGSGGRLSPALALARAGRLPEAIAAFRAGLARHPRDTAARLHLGIALYADGQTAPARREWEQVLTLGDPAAKVQAQRLLARYR